nr:MAG TPA: hypothetical protein [Caudoviricetes sp.]
MIVTKHHFTKSGNDLGYKRSRITEFLATNSTHEILGRSVI